MRPAQVPDHSCKSCSSHDDRIIPKCSIEHAKSATQKNEDPRQCVGDSSTGEADTRQGNYSNRCRVEPREKCIHRIWKCVPNVRNTNG